MAIRKGIVRILLSATVAVAGIGAWYAARGQTAAAGETSSAGHAAKAGAVAVRTVTATRKDVPVELQAAGTVVPLRAVDIRPQTSSILRAVHVREGQTVSAGELLFTLDDRNDRAALDKARAQLARDRATLADLERQHRRALDLAAQGYISPGAVDTLQSQVDAQRALVGSDLAAVQAAEVALGYDTIRAPMAGRVGAIAVHPGSLVQPSNALLTIVQIDPIEVGFSVPESSLPGLLAAQKAGRVAVQAALKPPGATLSGNLSFIDNAVDSSAGTVRVKARFDNHDAAMWPGQYVDVRLAAATLRDAVVIPAAAIVTDPSGRFVYSMESDGTAKPRRIELNHAFGTEAAVSGLAGGERIVVEGKQNLRPGSRVTEVLLAANDNGAPQAKK
jgi:RND family efflux transporter MFP subunit